jgi:hypothetical protein
MYNAAVHICSHAFSGAHDFDFYVQFYIHVVCPAWVCAPCIHYIQCVYTWRAHSYHHPLLLALTASSYMQTHTTVQPRHLCTRRATQVCAHLCTPLYVHVVWGYTSVHPCVIHCPCASMHTMYSDVCILAMYSICTAQQLPVAIAYQLLHELYRRPFTTLGSMSLLQGTWHIEYTIHHMPVPSSHQLARRFA